MRALALIDGRVPDWKYVCKVWPQLRTELQNKADLELARELDMKEQVSYITEITSRDFMPYLIGACDIYAAPARLEGFGMAQVEAGACGKPVVGMKAMGMLDTLVDGETAFLAKVAERIVATEVIIGEEAGFAEKQKIVFDIPRTVDYRADAEDIATHLQELMRHPLLRLQMGKAGRERAISHFDYRVVARKFVTIIQDKLGII
jgi:starch synthase